MFSAEDKALIRTLYAEKHVSIRCIAQMVHVSRNAVRRQIREEGKARAARSAAGAFLKEHAIDVQELYLACEMRCPPLRRRLNKDYQQDIPLRMLQRFCSPMRAEARRKTYLEDEEGKPLRYETLPGQHMQVDFGEKDVLVNGAWLHLHFFVCKLGYSRRMFAKAYYAETQDAWLDGMESAFRYFGGIPYCIVCDNASSLVRDHYANDDALKFTERFYHFLQYWGIKGIATAVRHPRSKGKVEAGVKYLKGNAVVGIDKRDLEAWNVWLELWCRTESDKRRLNTLFSGPFTPRERWLLEAPALRPYSKPGIAGTFFEKRKVGRDGLIRVDNRYYRVDNAYIGLEVQVQHGKENIIVRYGTKEVATLNKARDAFNPGFQAASTEMPQEAATKKQLEKLSSDAQWQQLRNSKNELNHDGAEYDAAVNWPQQEAA